MDMNQAAEEKAVRVNKRVKAYGAEDAPYGSASWVHSLIPATEGQIRISVVFEKASLDGPESEPQVIVRPIIAWVLMEYEGQTQPEEAARAISCLGQKLEAVTTGEADGLETSLDYDNEGHERQRQKNLDNGYLREEVFVANGTMATFQIEGQKEQIIERARKRLSSWRVFGPPKKQ